ncbi:MAG: T9SS type A sorting domain-containing protein [Calditrichaeota bacterium]|nr:T9SS type A sorting domain-containing protein [Calditrichota bacterium]
MCDWCGLVNSSELEEIICNWSKHVPILSLFYLNPITHCHQPSFFNQLFPNPFNSSCRLSYELPFNTKVSIVLYDVAGRFIKKMVNQNQRAGYHNCLIEASDLSSSVYFVRFSTDRFQQNQKLLLIR